ncbi:metallophosphoesterase [Clostridium sp.]|uniref:metallophosphoesterase n=1 Tax=Clostridium sp. TaxID=1506 RepID=UPI002633B82D|nr:metallophosphoesterase [Clostridium sp.]
MENKRKKAILHLSDLHIAGFNGNDFHKSRAANERYISLFTDTLNEIINNNLEIKYVIITGDLTNKSSPLEYKNVKEFLEKLLKEINCTWENVIIIPGNHDINRTDCEVELQKREVDNPKIDPSTFHDIKFEKYKKFYDEIYGGDFECTKAICNEVYDEELNILFIGINSLYKESNKDHLGYINDQALEDELGEITVKYNKDNLVKIALFHHPPDFGIGQSTSALRNWPILKEICKKNNIYIFLFGHVHKSDIKEEEGNLFFGCSSLALEDTQISNSFLIYKFDDDYEKLDVDRYVFMQDHGGKYGIGKWIKDQGKDNIKFRQNINNQTIKHKNISLKEENCSPLTQDSDFEDTYLNDSKVITDQLNNEESDCNKLINIVKTERLFTSGHFHWGENLKSHGWLNTNLLLSNHSNIKVSIKAILRLISEKKIKPDIIIGIGMEGNILGSLIAIVLGKRYTYVPINNRDANEYEEKVTILDNDRVLFITDTIFSGNTKKLILEKYNNEFSNVKDISIISLFCTGNLEEIQEKIQVAKFYSVCNEIKIPLCTLPKEECAVSKYKLNFIYDF